MSALAALVSLDGAPAAARDIDALIGRMRLRGPDALHSLADGPAALGFALLQTLPDDRPGAQPAWDRTGGCVALLDGRIDNREDIADACGLRFEGQADAALLADAYQARGTNVLSQLLGDYALIIWDRNRRSLFATRDVFGRRPLFVRRGGATLMLASELQALVRSGPSSPDEGMVGEALTGSITSLTGTLYAGISRIRPGWLLRVEGGTIATTSIASVTATAQPPRTDAEWADAFRDRFDRAVRARTRACGPVGVMLSGGTDSTVVLTSACAGAAPGLSAWTIDGEPGASEVDAARGTAGAFGVEHTVVASSAASYDYAGSSARFLDRATYPSGANSMALRRAAAAAGTRVLLTGVGGDEGFSTNNWHCADLLAAGRLRALVRAWRTLAATTDPPTARDLLQATFAPQIPAWLGPIARRVSGLGRPPAWIDRRFASRIALADRLRERAAPTGHTVAERARLWHVCGGATVSGQEETDRLAAESTTDDRAPFFDRRVLELALSAPTHLVALAPENKAFVRAAYEAHLPARMRQPVPALNYEYLLAQALGRIGGRTFFDRLLVEEAGWVDGAWVRSRLATGWEDGRADGPADSDMALALWNIAAMELWARAYTGETGARPAGAEEQ